MTQIKLNSAVHSCFYSAADIYITFFLNSRACHKNAVEYNGTKATPSVASNLRTASYTA